VSLDGRCSTARVRVDRPTESGDRARCGKVAENSRVSGNRAVTGERTDIRRPRRLPLIAATTGLGAAGERGCGDERV